MTPEERTAFDQPQNPSSAAQQPLPVSPDENPEDKGPVSILPAYDRIQKMLSDPNTSPQDVGNTLMMLRHARTLPAHLQHAMNNPSVPIHQVVQALHQHAGMKLDQAMGRLNPVLRGLASLHCPKSQMEPDSPLPWEMGSNEIVAKDGTLIVFDLNYSQDTDYLIHACNSYPKLIEFVKRAHVGLHAYEAEDLLEELGEL